MATRNTFRYFLLCLFLFTLLITGCTRVFRSQTDGEATTPDDNATVVDDTTAAEGDQAELPDTSAEALAEVGGESTTEETTEDETESAETTDSSAGETPRDEEPAAGEATNGEGETVEEVTTAEGSDEEPAGSEEGEPTDSESEETPTAEEDESADGEGESAAAEESAAEETVVEETPAETTAEDESAAATGDGNTIPHVVQPGENLYRIGLLYGVSWVTLSQVNGLGDADVISAGQVIQIPTAAAPEPTATPSPTTEVVYIVQPGDSLFSIGLAYGLTWDQIAEANGIVNPNAIYLGQELKIPAGAPGPAPQFMHTVEGGDTLLRLSVRYGVTWQAIAEANNLTSPYVLYPGQTLVIPGQ